MRTGGGMETTSMQRVAGKVAVVAGAASGIGRATALSLGRHGASVVCADLNRTGAEDCARDIVAAGSQALGCVLDVTSEADWDRAVELTREQFGRPDVLVNSAGISFTSPVADMSLEDWQRVLAVNLDAVFLGTRAAIRAMRPGPGSIINVSSASGLKASPGASAYSASKAAVCMFSRTAARECLDAGQGIRINTVCPGGVKTPLWSTMPFFQDLVRQAGSEEAAFQALAGKAPGARFAEPTEIALAILYLASDESRFVTGTDLVIDNGYTI